MQRHSQNDRGFSLLELLVATAIFLVICAAMFGLLQVSQQKYSMESQLSGSFQEARLGIDQIVRDVNISGYPSVALFSNPASSISFALGPFAWDPGYLSNTDCQLGSICSTPGDYDLIVETNLGDGNGVSWIHYQLQGTTLFRAVVPKTAGSDPVAATTAAGLMTPLVNNVVNNTSSLSTALLAQINAEYPSMFPGGPQPLFAYSCATPSGSVPCSTAGTYNAPRYISDVDITLIVMTPTPDIQTGTLKLIELTSRGHRSNPGN